MRRAVISWIVAVAILAGAATGGVFALGATVFGAGAFVRVYLEALARGDAEGALTIPGVTVPAGARDDFLVPETLSGLQIDALTEETREDGIHLVSVTWRTLLGDGESTFAVERAGSRFGMFPAWEFAVSPIATLDLTVRNDDRFQLAGVAATSEVGASDPVAYAVFTPGIYRVDHRSTYLRADAVDVVAARPGATLDAALDVVPTDAFLEAATALVEDELTACATQRVLFPTGCPFGRAIANRVVSEPAWSIAEFPDVTLEPAAEFGAWLMPTSGFSARLEVEVQSLFDGSLSTLDEEVPASASYLVRILADDVTLRLELVS